MNPIEALTTKKRRLLDMKRKIQQDNQRIIDGIDKEVAEIDRAIETVNKAVEPLLCSRCYGTGSIRRCDAAGQMEDDGCPVCKGTGIKPDEPK